MHYYAPHHLSREREERDSSQVRRPLPRGCLPDTRPPIGRVEGIGGLTPCAFSRTSKRGEKGAKILLSTLVDKLTGENQEINFQYAHLYPVPEKRLESSCRGWIYRPDGRGLE